LSKLDLAITTSNHPTQTLKFEEDKKSLNKQIAGSLDEIKKLSEE